MGDENFAANNRLSGDPQYKFKRRRYNPKRKPYFKRTRKIIESDSHLFLDDLDLVRNQSALATRAKIFVGNDSGIAHIAAAVKTPSVVIFGSSNRNHWRPWTDAPNEIVYEEFACQPCAGYVCEEFGEPKCILSVKTENVIEAIENVLRNFI